MKDDAFTKEEIDGNAEIASLIDWWDEMDDQAKRVRAAVDIRALGNVSEDEWFFRASDRYSYCETAKSRIEKKLFRLGFDGRLEPEHVSISEIKEFRRYIHDIKTRINVVEKQLGIGNEQREARIAERERGK